MLKELAGNPGHRPLNSSEPKPEAGAPEMPKGLRKSAQREWKRLVPELLRLGLLTRIDGKALAMYVDCYADWEEAQRDCVRNGLVLDAPVLDKDSRPVFVTDHCMECPQDGETPCLRGLEGCQSRPLIVRKESPAFAVKQKAMKTMKSFLIEFGLTPASRSKLHVEPPKTVDPFEDFMKGPQRATTAAVDNAKQNAPLHFNTGKRQPVNTNLTRLADIKPNDFEA